MDQDHKNYKTSLCRHFTLKGYCSLYDNCHFAHGQQELRTRIDPVPSTVPPVLKPVSIYKTQLCKYFMNGYCRNDSVCPFAHGEQDLHGMVVVSMTPPKPKQDYGQAGEFLFSILRNLEQVFQGHVELTGKVKRGQEKVKQGDLHQANQIITEIVADPVLPEKQRQQCQTILSNAYSLHKINFIPF